MANDLDTFMLNYLRGGTPQAPAQNPSIPLPRPDPRGSTFAGRLPPGIYEQQQSLEQNPFGADNLPAQVLMNSNGYSPNSDGSMIIPPEKGPERQVFYPSTLLPPKEGGGKYAMYMPTPQNVAFGRDQLANKLEAMINALNKK